MAFSKETLESFLASLASSAPTPGGGGASALAGAVAAALGRMVGSLTLGKARYAAVQDDILALNARADALISNLLSLMDQDAEAFAPLARAYALPKDTEAERSAKAEVLEAALVFAVQPPLSIMRACAEAVELLEQYEQKGSVMALSDVGCGASLAKAAIVSASLNVFINTKSMLDRAKADALNAEADMILTQYPPRAEAIVLRISQRYR